MFATRRNPSATRFFYALTPTEDERTQQTIKSYTIDDLAAPSASIFDAAIMVSSASHTVLQERCLEIEKEFGFKLSFEPFTGPYCVARKLLVSGRGVVTGQILTQTGRTTCLFDSVSYIASENEKFAFPCEDEAPLSVRSYNAIHEQDSQRGDEILWLTHCPTQDAIKILTGQKEGQRRRLNLEQTVAEFVCYQMPIKL